MNAIKENVIAYIEANSYLQLDDEEEISFTTRRHGNVGDGIYSEDDYYAAIEIGKKVKKEFENIDYSIDTCDEWVNLYVTIN